MQYFKIPEDRVGVLIGVDGKVKSEIEEKTGTEIKVEDVAVSIEGDPLGILTAKEIVLAIGRGFSPEIAFRLFKDKNVLELIRLNELLGSDKEIRRKKGRVIGKKGKTRKYIEGMTNTHICVYGKTIGIIGEYEYVDIAKEAIIRLLEGARHSSVYRFLEKSVKELKESEVLSFDEYYEDLGS